MLTDLLVAVLPGPSLAAWACVSRRARDRVRFHLAREMRARFPDRLVRPNLHNLYSLCEGRCALCLRKYRPRWHPTWKVLAHKKCLREQLLNEYYFDFPRRVYEHLPHQTFWGWGGQYVQEFAYEAFWHRKHPSVADALTIEGVQETAAFAAFRREQARARLKKRFYETVLTRLVAQVKNEQLIKKRRARYDERMTKLKAALARKGLTLESVPREVLGDFDDVSVLRPTKGQRKIVRECVVLAAAPNVLARFQALKLPRRRPDAVTVAYLEARMEEQARASMVHHDVRTQQRARASFRETRCVHCGRRARALRCAKRMCALCCEDAVRVPCRRHGV